jgi:formate dehydrogenase subunit gamma
MDGWEITGRAMRDSNSSKQFTARLNPLLWVVLITLLVYLSPLSAEEPTATKAPTAQLMNPASELWQAVRQRNAPASGKTQVKGIDSGVLINTNGDRWKTFRMSQLIPIAGYVLGGVIAILAVFYLVRGRVPVEGGLSNSKLLRYTSYERTIHWLIAGLFIFLAVTGLLITFGRSVLIPLMGKEAFSVLASLSKDGHNLLGPLFLLALVLIFLRFVRRNIYQKGDLTWLLRGGGIVGKKHVPSNFFNMGEKTMFWLLVFVGGTIALSGLLLLLPVFGVGREWMELAHVGHAVGAVLMISVILGHIYIGTIGMEGAIEGMKTGYCDLNWAKEHHDLWATQAEKDGQVFSNEEVARLRGDSTRKPGDATA